MRSDPSALVREAVLAMESGNVPEASRALHLLAHALREHEAGDGVLAAGAWDAFKQLLARRGFLVDTPQGLASSLDEIRGVGPEFDLYELARALALCDLALTAQAGASSQWLFPQLQPFAENPEVST